MPKTALDLSPEEWLTYQPNNTAIQDDLLEHNLTDRKDRALDVAQMAAQHLKEKFGATRVMIFGSLAHKAWFNAHSDIDLAAWDIPPDQFYRAVAFISGLSSEFEIDLVDPENCRPSIQQAIERDGLEI